MNVCEAYSTTYHIVKPYIVIYQVATKITCGWVKWVWIMVLILSKGQ